jgi:hypothetical protein
MIDVFEDLIPAIKMRKKKISNSKGLTLSIFGLLWGNLAKHE